MSIFETLAEQKIQEGLRKGAFKNLAGQGKPIELEDLSGVDPEYRMAYKILKNAGYLPPEVEFKKEIDELEKKVRECSLEDEKKRLLIELSEKMSLYNVMKEKLKTSHRL